MKVRLIRIEYATLMMAQIRVRNAYLVVILCRETFRLSIFVLDLLLGNGQICFDMYLCYVNNDSPLDFIFHIGLNCDWGLGDPSARSNILFGARTLVWVNPVNLA